MKYKILTFIMILFLSLTVNAEGEATIKNIKVNGTSCTCTGYDCVVDVNAQNATITYDLVDKDATVDRLSGFKLDLLSEVTTIKLTVTNSVNEEKIQNIYNITINKKEEKVDLSLKSLKVNGEIIKLFPDVVAYSYTSKYDAKSITIDVIPTNSTVKVVKDNKYDFPLEDSSLSIDFTVNPPSGNGLDYRVVVTRGVKPDTTLKSLKVNDKNIELSVDKLDYDLTVEYSENELKIDAVPENEDAKVEIDNKTLIVGENEIKITVTNGNTKSEYTLFVTREENVDKSVANLKELKIDEYRRLDFKENVLDYTLNFSSIPDKLTIHPKAKNGNSEITVIGNEKLKNDSKITIEVKLGNIKREYTLTIKESKNISDNKDVVLGTIIGLSIVIIILIIIEIHSKRQAKRKYLKKIFDLRHKIERKRKEEKEKKVRLRLKPKEKENKKTKDKDKQIDDDGIEII